MRRLTLALFLACALAPATARANTGGFWDFLYGLDAKLMGGGADIHLACLNAAGQRLANCEEFFGLKRADDTELNALKDIKHQFDFRFAYYRKYGVSFDGVSDADDTSINAWKLMGLYSYHADKHIKVGLGGGYMPFYGSKFNSFWRGIVTPLSVTYSPATEGPNARKALFVRGEVSYITQGFGRKDFGVATVQAPTSGEWNVSLAVGVNFLRRKLP